MNNSKNKPWLIIVLVFVFACVFLCMLTIIGILLFNNIALRSVTDNASLQPTVDQTPVSAPVSSTTDIKITPQSLTDSGTSYTIDVTYPKASSSNQSLADFVNTSIMTFVNSEITSIKDPTGYVPGTSKFSLTMEYTVEYKSSNLLSILITGDFFSGGAHGAPIVKTFNFDLNTQKELGLNDVFNSTTGYLNNLSSICRIDLMNMMGSDGDATSVNAGTTAVADNFKNWNFSDGGMMFTFDAYQVGPYAIGTPSITVQYSKLYSMMQNNISTYLQTVL
ncbi:MAG: DUF4163 domain-containing protein [Bacillota bacterium]|nr:DUF4163 domain-containing protein [Bacillota bacterium]